MTHAVIGAVLGMVLGVIILFVTPITGIAPVFFVALWGLIGASFGAFAGDL